MSNEYEELKRRFIAHRTYQRQQRVSGVVKFLVVSILLIMLITVI